MDRTAIRKGLLAQLREDKVDVSHGLDDHARLSDGLGLDSIEVVSLIVNIQDRFGIEFQNAELDKIVTVGDLVDLLQLKLTGERSAA